LLPLKMAHGLAHEGAIAALLRLSVHFANRAVALAKGTGSLLGLFLEQRQFCTVIETQHPSASVVQLEPIVFLMPVFGMTDLALPRNRLVGVPESLHRIHTSVIESLHQR